MNDDTSDDEVEVLMVVSPTLKRKPPPEAEVGDRKLSKWEQNQAAKAARQEQGVEDLKHVVVDVWVPGRPKPKRRPMKSKIGAIYNPSYKEEKAFKDEFQNALVSKYPRLGMVFTKRIPIRVELSFVYPQAKFTLHTSADVDNLAKLVLDSNAGTVFDNDNQVIELVARKCPSNDETAGTRVVIAAASVNIMCCSNVASK